jgi:hypothetical protein
MDINKVSVSQMWKREEGGEVYLVTSLYKDLFSSYALLRNVNQRSSEVIKRAKLVKSASGDIILGFSAAEMV